MVVCTTHRAAQDTEKQRLGNSKLWADVDLDTYGMLLRPTSTLNCQTTICICKRRLQVGSRSPDDQRCCLPKEAPEAATLLLQSHVCAHRKRLGQMLE